MLLTADGVGSKPGSEHLPLVVFDLASRVNIRTISFLHRRINIVTKFDAKKTCPSEISDCKYFLKLWTAGPTTVNFQVCAKLPDNVVVADVDHVNVT